jgi:hypothetical protein
MPIVGAVIGAIGVATSLFGSIFGGAGKRDAAYAGAALTDQQAEFTKRETTEEYRRFQFDADQRIGMAQAAAGASGFANTKGNTMNKYVQAVATELGKEGGWLWSSGMFKANMQHQAADVQRQAADAGLWGDILGGVGGALQGAGNIVGMVNKT